eukprot:scaffold5581_cov90-Phaeocystis_antarctica.AAC.1
MATYRGRRARASSTRLARPCYAVMAYMLRRHDRCLVPVTSGRTSLRAAGWPRYPPPRPAAAAPG